MLHTTILTAGCVAQWQGQVVRIHQMMPGGDAMIFCGPDRTRRVAIDELAAIPADDPLSVWKERRVETSDRFAFTTIELLYADYAAFCEAAGLHDFRIYSQASFGRAMAAHGFRWQRKPVRNAWDAIVRVDIGFQANLRPGDPRDAAPEPARPAPRPRLAAPKKIARKGRGRA